jgi:hypothetical protein
MSRRRRNAAWVISAAVFAVAVHVAVAGGVAPRTNSAVPAPLTGTWGKKVSDATWHEYGIYYEIAGHWAIAITKGGVASLFTPPGQPKEAQPLTTMHAAATGGSAVFGPTADGFCPTNATYGWKPSRSTLTFTAVKDGCDARRVLLTVGTWTRQ